MSLIRGVYLHDGFGNPISSSGGAVSIHNGGVHNYVINDSFHRDTAVSTTVSVQSSIGATSITVASSTGFSVGDNIKINGKLNYVKILSVIGNVISINQPLGSVVSVGSTVVQVVLDVSSSSGSITSPVSYKVVPTSNQIWNIERIVLEMIHPTAGDLSLFGNIAQLTNGVVLRKYDGASSTYGTFTVWNTNEDIYLDTANIQFLTRSGGGGSFATVAFGSFSDIGVTVKLDSDAGDYLEVLVQDDITSLDNMKMKIQGYLEQ